MTNNSDEVVARSIASLRQLSSLLAAREPQRQAKELLLSIRILLPKLEAARPMLDLAPPSAGCAVCDE